MADAARQYRSWKDQQLQYSHLWTIGLGITAMFTVVPNFLVIYAVMKDPNRNLRNSPSNLLIASQSMADLCVGAVQEMVCIWWFRTFDPTAIRVIEMCSSVFMVASILHVLALGYDRYVAVVTPLHYTARMTVKRTYISSAVVWGYSLFYMAIRTVLQDVFGQKRAVNILTGLNTVFPSFLGVIIYVMLYHFIRKYKKRAHKLDASGRAVMQAYIRHRKMTCVLMAAFLLFLFCLTPWFVFYQVIDACPNCEHNKDVEMYLFVAFFYIFMFKSLLNPFLYAWRLTKYRNAISRLVPCCGIPRRIASASEGSSANRGIQSFRRSVNREAQTWSNS